MISNNKVLTKEAFGTKITRAWRTEWMEPKKLETVTKGVEYRQDMIKVGHTNIESLQLCS